MTTIADIRAGKECPGCSADCKRFVDEADMCIYQTFISELYSEVVKDDSAEEVHYEPDSRHKTILTTRNVFISLDSELVVV